MAAPMAAAERSCKHPSRRIRPIGTGQAAARLRLGGRRAGEGPIHTRPGVQRSQRKRLRRLAALALLPSLSGCMAVAVAIPVAAAAGMIGKNVRVRAATPVPERRAARPTPRSPRPRRAGATR